MPSARTLVVAFLVVLAGCAGAPPTDDPTPTTQTTVPDTTTSTATTATTTPTSTTDAPGTEWQVTVEEVVDGDTLTVRFPDGHTEDVRLLGVDTPEVHVENDPPEFEGIPDTAAGRDWLRSWGHKASAFAQSELAGEQVTVKTDPQADRRGDYGRLLVYVYQGETRFNLELVQRGLARMYDSTFRYRDAYAQAEADAQSGDVGLWGFDSQATSTTTPTTTTDGGDVHLSVVEMHPDAAGNDNENLNGEFVVFRNDDSSAVDLTGWHLRDDAGHAYAFPDGYTLDAGALVTVYTGNGTDAGNDLYWDAGQAVWNNGGDTVVVTDASGVTVVSKAY